MSDQQKPAGDADLGKGNEAPAQLTSTEGLSPAEIVKALDEGRLDDYLATGQRSS